MLKRGVASAPDIDTAMKLEQVTMDLTTGGLCRFLIRVSVYPGRVESEVS